MLFFKTTKSGARTRRKMPTQFGLVAAAFAVVTLGACDDLLDVDLPGSVTGESLDDPALAETLVLSVIGDFECGLTDTWYAGEWTEEWLNTSASRPDALMGFRSALTDVYADPCDSGTGPIWTTYHVPIQQAERAIDLITGFDQADVDTNKDLLIATANLYAGYSIQLLSETFCGVPILGSLALTPAAASAEAEARFSLVINSAAPASSEKDELLAAAYIGRARAHLWQGEMAEAVADASNAAIPVGFKLEATYDNSPGRRNNRLFERNNLDESLMPHRDYVTLTVRADGELTIADGVADPRVPIKLTGKKEPRGILAMRMQQKFIGEDAEIPFSTWREAQLIIAEAEPAQSVARINVLRASGAGSADDIDTSAWPLTAYAGGSAAAIAATVREERRRELWMQGNQAGDKVRYGNAGLLTPSNESAPQNTNDGGTNWETNDEFGSSVSPGGCIPIPFIEVIGNPNL